VYNNMNNTTLNITIYYTIDKSGNKVYDIDAIRKDFESKLDTLGTKENFYEEWRKENIEDRSS